MNETSKIWLCTMLHNELSEVKNDIRNNHVWRKGCTDANDLANLDDCLENLTEYQEILEAFKNQIEKGKFNV